LGLGKVDGSLLREQLAEGEDAGHGYHYQDEGNEYQEPAEAQTSSRLYHAECLG
jgi:hypothetical protein